MADITKSKLPLVAALGMLSAAATGAGTWAVAAERLETSRARIERLETRQDDASKDAEAQRLKSQRLEDALVNVAEMVREIRQDVKDLKRR